MDIVIVEEKNKHLSRQDLNLHYFYLVYTKKESHLQGKGKRAIAFISDISGNTGKVHYFYEKEKYITHSDIKYLLENFEIKENVTEKCKLICEL